MENIFDILEKEHPDLMKDYESKLLNVIQKRSTCHSICKKNNTPCEESTCRLWIDYKSDLNCTEIAVQNNGKMVFRDR